MDILSNKRNHVFRPTNNEELTKLRTGKWTNYDEQAQEGVRFRGIPYQLRRGLTFTPFANPTPCNAHCGFCSEELQRKHQQHLTSKSIINDYDQYFEALAEVFDDLRAVEQVGLSLSGLEATSDPVWLLRLLDLLQQDQAPQFNEKVLYTNATGLHNHPALVEALQATRFDRLEVSRCHYNDEVNQRVMFFNRNEPVHKNAAYEPLIRRIAPLMKIKNSCILTQTGINNVDEIERYLEWMMGLGVSTVVFRELSILDETYVNNRTRQWTEQNRVALDGLLQTIMPQLDQVRPHWTYQYTQAGYYYYNEYFTYKNSVEVILETSSYDALMRRNAQDMVQKLVFHSNGNLCGDWDPDSEVLANYFAAE